MASLSNVVKSKIGKQKIANFTNPSGFLTVQKPHVVSLGSQSSLFLFIYFVFKWWFKMLVCHVNKEDKKIFQKLYATTFVCVFALLGKAKDYGYAYADMLACSP